MIDTDKYEGLTMNDMEHLELWEFSRKLFAEVKRLREAIADIADLIELVSHTEHQRAIIANLRKVIE
tara:strand:- start:320 stop:520 length:201 start_codon:yes stop_codon:yes gene_type:complete